MNTIRAQFFLSAAILMSSLPITLLHNSSNSVWISQHAQSLDGVFKYLPFFISSVAIMIVENSCRNLENHILQQKDSTIKLQLTSQNNQNLSSKDIKKPKGWQHNQYSKKQTMLKDFAKSGGEIAVERSDLIQTQLFQPSLLKKLIFILICVVLIFTFLVPLQLFEDFVQIKFNVISDANRSNPIILNSITVCTTLVKLIVGGSVIGSYPMIVSISTKFWGCRSATERMKVSYSSLFAVYCAMWGLLLIILPIGFYNDISTSLTDLFTTNNNLLRDSNENFILRTTGLTHDLTVKYLLFPVFQLIRLPTILISLIFKIIGTKKRLTMRFDTHMKMAYFSHLHVVSIAFAPFCPVICVFGSVLLGLFHVFDRFNIETNLDVEETLQCTWDAFCSSITCHRVGIVFMIVLLAVYASNIDHDGIRNCLLGVIFAALIAFVCWAVYAHHRLGVRLAAIVLL